MSVIFNEASVGEKTIAEGVTVKRLITPERVQSDNVLTEIVSLAPGAETAIEVGKDDLSWAHVIAGTAELDGAAGRYALTTDHFLLLPPGFSDRLTSKNGARLFRATVPRAARFDPAFASRPPEFRCVDWTEEPVLDSEHDARKRIYMVTPKLFGTDVAKGEMILYPAGTAASNHYHEGADHFMYVLRGSAQYFLNEAPQRVKQGDTVYIYENERHYFVNDGAGEMAFIEYFIPGKYSTIWVENAPICTWHPTGRNIRGGKASRAIGAHTSMDEVSDV